MKAVLLNTKHDQLLYANGGYFCDAGGVARAELIQLHHPLTGIVPSHAKVGLPKSFLIDLVNHRYQQHCCCDIRGLSCNKDNERCMP